jgi:hypothetical protein
VPIFTADEREHLRSELVSAAQNDPNLCGAAHTGSAASLSTVSSSAASFSAVSSSSRLDRWSDIDLALCFKPDAKPEHVIRDIVIRDWTDRLYRQHGAVAHVDVMRGATLFRVFLLRNTLQVDIAFWSAREFGAIGPNFQLIFMREGYEAKPPLPAPQPNTSALIGMAWLYALHVRSSLTRGRILQAEYMLSGMRNHVFELTCLRYGVIAQQGRGLDDLPAAERDAAAGCIPQSLNPAELRRGFQNTMRMFVREIRHVDRAQEGRLAEVLNEIVG